MMKIVKDMGVIVLLMVGGVVPATYASSAAASAEVALTTSERHVYEKAERPGEFVVVLVNTTQKQALERYLASPRAIADCCRVVVGLEPQDPCFGVAGVASPWGILKRSLISNYLMAFGNIERTVDYLTSYGALFEKKKEVIEFLVQKCVEYNIILSVEGNDQLEY
jgi:hypothetical protein